MELMMPQDSLLAEMKLNDYLKNNTIYLDCEIDRSSQVLFCRQLRKLAEQELSKPEADRKSIKVRISSFGGWVVSVFAMISEMEYWQERSIIIETYCDGYCCSGGSKILCAGSKGHRYITRYGSVLIHQPQHFDCGSKTLQDKINELKYDLKDWEILKSILTKHTKLTEEDIINLTDKNVDVTYYPEECVKKSIVDYIL